MRIPESGSGDGCLAVNALKAAGLCTSASGLVVGQSCSTWHLGPAVLNVLWKPCFPWLQPRPITNTRGVLGALFLLWKEVGEEPVTEGSPGLPCGSRGRGHTVGAEWGEDLPMAFVLGSCQPRMEGSWGCWDSPCAERSRHIGPSASGLSLGKTCPCFCTGLS